MSFNYTKWGFILGTGIAVVTLIASVIIPEFRCFIGLKSESCSSKDNFVNIKLIVETEDAKSLEGVEVRFIPLNGGPEIRTTNSDGYVKIKIPSTGDIDVKLSKEGFQTLNRTINLEIEPDIIKTYRLKKIVFFSTQEPTSTSINSPYPINTSPSITNNPSPSGGQSVFRCLKNQGFYPVNYPQDISVGLKYQKSDSRILLNKNYPYSTTCRITKNTGNLQFVFALPDNSLLEKVKVDFYLDGNLVKSLDITRGSLASSSLNTINISSFAINFRVDNDDGNQDYLYFIPASTN